MAGKTVGRTYIRVIPDATKFRNDLKLLLKRVENSMSANLAVTADTTPFETDVRKLVKKWNGQDVELDVDAKSTAFSAHMKALTRRRSVNVDVKVSKASIAKAGTVIASLAGGRLVGDLVKNVGESLLNLDRSLPKLTAVALGIASIGAAGLNAVNGLGGVIVGLGQLVPLAALLPGFLAAAGLSLTTFIVALKDAPNSVKAAANAYKSLQSVISTNFWAQAARPIRQFLNELLPQFKTGFAGLASELGKDFASVAGVLANVLGGGELGFIFDEVTAGAAAALPGVQEFAASFISLLGYGATYLPIFGGWVTKIGQQFTNWLAGVESSGELNRMIQSGITALGQLGSAVVSVGRIFSGVFTATGGDALGGFSSGLASIAKIINGPTFQIALSTIFAGAAEGAKGLGLALAPIGSMLSSLAPALSQILSSSGVVVGQILGDIADALSQPAFQTGLQNFFAGIQTGLLAIAPALPAVASAFGALGTFAGNLAAQLGPVLGAALSALAPVLTSLLNALTPILPILGDALVSALTDLGPALVQVVKAIAPLLPPLIEMVVSYLPEFVVVLQAVSDALVVLSPLLTGLLVFISSIVKAANGVWKFGEALLAGASATSVVADALSGKFGPLVQSIAGWAFDAGRSVAAALSSINRAVTGTGKGILDLVHNIGGWIGSIVNAVSTAIGSVVAAVSSALAPVVKVWQFIWNIIATVVEAVFVLIVSVITIALYTVSGFIQSIVGAIASWWSGVWNSISSVVSTVWESIVAVVTVGVNAVLGVVTVVWNAISSVVTTVLGVVLGTVSAVLGAISSVWLTVWGGISSFFSGLWSGFLDIVSGPLNAVKGFISDTINNISDTWNKIWGGLGDIVKSIWSGVQGSVKDGINGVIDLINGMIGAINKVADAASTISGGAISLHVKPIPHLALGATVEPRPGGTLALLGEAGRAESVVDEGLLNRQLALSNALIAKAVSSGGTSSVYAPVTVQAAPGQDERLIGRAAGRELVKALGGN